MSSTAHGGELPVAFAVDDEHFNLELLERTLRSGYQVQTFDDPIGALGIVERVKPSIVLTDYRMPSLTGVEFLRELRKRGLTCAALLVTGYADWEQVDAAERQQIGFQVILKPW